MISEEDYFFPTAKKNGVEFILIDTGAGVICFNLLILSKWMPLTGAGLKSESGTRSRPLRVQGVGKTGVAGNIHFYEDRKNVLAMSTLVNFRLNMQLATTSAGLYHCDTHTLVCALLIHGIYYITEHNLSCLLLRNTCEIEEAANAAHIEGNENRDQDDEIPYDLNQNELNSETVPR